MNKVCGGLLRWRVPIDSASDLTFSLNVIILFVILSRLVASLTIFIFSVRFGLMRRLSGQCVFMQHSDFCDLIFPFKVCVFFYVSMQQIYLSDFCDLKYQLRFLTSCEQKLDMWLSTTFSKIFFEVYRFLSFL